MDESARNRHGVVAGLATGCFLTWNVSNVGAVADPLAEAYGTSLAVVGLLTTALFVTHLAAQLPAGIWSDRFGPHRVALAACAAAALGNAVLLVDDDVGVAAVGRLVVGLGSGAGSSPGSTSFARAAEDRCSRALRRGDDGRRRPRARDRAAAHRRDELARAVRDRARARRGAAVPVLVVRGSTGRTSEARCPRRRPLLPLGALQAATLRARGDRRELDRAAARA